MRAWRSAHEAQIVGQLDEITRIRSIAADPAGLTAAADRLQRLLAERGFAARQIPTGPGAAPLVFGELKTPGARRTVLFYAHYDGQPVTPAEWRSDPFVPVMRSDPPGPDVRDIDWRGSKTPLDPEWRLYGRAASDDKASIVAFLSAFDALSAAGRRPSVNIKVLWEGEEEAGSPHLEAALRSNQAVLAADLVLIGDAPVHPSRRRMLYFGARGSLGLEIKLYGPLHALHDGHYGNWAPNPAVMAAGLIAAFRNDEGAILIPGFSDDVRPLTATERAAIAALPRVEPELRRSFGLGRSEGDEGLTASTMRPALNIRGIRSGQVGGQAARRPTPSRRMRWCRSTSASCPARRRKARARAWSPKGWTIVRQDPDLETRLAHIVNHDNNQHAADENMRLQNLWDGVETYAGMLADLSW